MTARLSGAIAANLDDPARLTDLAASNLDLKLEEAQGILETIDPVERLKKVNEMLTREINLLTMQQEISSAAQGEMNKSQREYFLRQQLKAIQSELGEGEELAEEVENYRKKIEEKSIPQEAREEVEKQIKRLERSHPDSAETSIIRTYNFVEEKFGGAGVWDLLLPVGPPVKQPAGAAADAEPYHVSGWLLDLCAAFSRWYDLGNRDPSLKVLCEDRDASTDPR